MLVFCGGGALARFKRMDAVRVAFAHFIDYAGLYPPASLPLDDVIERYARYHAGPMSWMLGRLILPAERMAEASRLASAAGATAVGPVASQPPGGTREPLPPRAEARWQIPAPRCLWRASRRWPTRPEEIAAISSAYPAQPRTIHRDPCRSRSGAADRRPRISRVPREGSHRRRHGRQVPVHRGARAVHGACGSRRACR